jgi:hypothetical protein
LILSCQNLQYSEKTSICFWRSSLVSDICVVYNNCKSDFFRCENGVKQGENWSPFLFSIFLNDLESYLQSKDVSGLITLSEEIENQYCYILHMI